MIFGKIADAVVALSQAYSWHAKNASLRAVGDNARELYEAEVEYYNLQNGNDGTVDVSRIQLADIRVQFLKDHQRRLSAVAETGASPVLNPPGGNTPSGPGTENKPG